MHELTHGMGMTSRLSPVGPSGSPTGLNNQNSDLSSMTTYDVRTVVSVTFSISFDPSSYTHRSIYGDPALALPHS